MASDRSFDGNRTARWSVAAAVALGAHVALAFGASAMPEHAPEAPLVTELELAPPPPPPAEAPAPAPEPEKVETSEPASPAEPRSAAPRPSVTGAPAARAGKLLTVNDDAPAPTGSEPVDFVTDPNGSTYAGGVVARGGTGGHGAQGTAIPAAASKEVASKVVRSTPKSDIVKASDLSRAPSLSTGTNCAGYYPRGADADSAIVSLLVVVGSDGGIARLSVASESPAGQGFGSAARACIGTGRFSPGLDKDGRSVKSATRVRVRFTR